MKLDKLIDFYRAREYQISHLINARKCYQYGKQGEQRMYIFLLLWADAMYHADEIYFSNGFSDANFKARGLK